MPHPHASLGVGQGNPRRVAGLANPGPGSVLSATPAVPAQAPGLVTPGPGPVALPGNAPVAVSDQFTPQPFPVQAQPAAPALDPLASARGRQFSDGFNPRSIF